MKFTKLVVGFPLDEWRERVGLTPFRVKFLEHSVQLIELGGDYVERRIRPLLIMDARRPIITVMLLRELSHNSRV